MPVTNKDRFPNATFLSDDEIEAVGATGGVKLVLVGWDDDGENTPLVSRSMTDSPGDEALFAVPLYELMTLSQDSIEITESLDKP